MRLERLERAQVLPRPLGEVFAFFSEAENRHDLERIFDYRQAVVSRLLG